MTFLGVSERKLVRPFIPQVINAVTLFDRLTVQTILELQKVSTSFDTFTQQIVLEVQRVAVSIETLMHVLVWVVVTCVAVHVWRQWAEEARAKKIHAARTTLQLQHE